MKLPDLFPATKLPGLLPPTELPGAGARIPGFVVRLAFVVAAVLLTLVDYRLTGWFAVGVVIALAAAWAPQYLLGWALILFLAAGQLTRHAALSWRFLVLLAGLHLLHVLAMLALHLPWRSWLQPAVFLGSLRRFLVIQVPTQLLAIIALLLLAPGSDGHRPVVVAGFALIGALALTALALLFTVPRPDEG
jgi:hypothetical protein